MINYKNIACLFLELFAIRYGLIYWITHSFNENN